MAKIKAASIDMCTMGVSGDTDTTTTVLSSPPSVDIKGEVRSITWDIDKALNDDTVMADAAKTYSVGIPTGTFTVNTLPNDETNGVLASMSSDDSDFDNKHSFYVKYGESGSQFHAALVGILETVSATDEGNRTLIAYNYRSQGSLPLVKLV